MNETSLQKSLDQQRAKAAWNCISEVLEKREEIKKKYGSLARKVPTLVLTNGLGQTLAFLKSKGKANQKQGNDEHDLIFKHLSSWVLHQVDGKNQTNNDLLKWVLDNDSNAYRRATTEALAFLNWLKRFAEAELPVADQEE